MFRPRPFLARSDSACSTAMTPCRPPYLIVVPRVRDPRRRIAFGPRREHETGKGLQVHVHARPRAARTGVTVTRQTDVDETRIVAVQRVVIELQPSHDAGAEVLDDDVGNEREAPCNGMSGLILEIEADRALVAVLVGGAVLVAGIAGTALDVHDIGAQIRQRARAKRSGENVGKVEHFQPGERTRNRLAFPSKREYPRPSGSTSRCAGDDPPLAWSGFRPL